MMKVKSNRSKLKGKKPLGKRPRNSARTSYRKG
jgi:hypothetical protein